jgi:N,N'-diacetyllegionaminate synthase
MITGLIAELGNHHFGNLASAKEMIRVARECGAAYAKMQAIDTDWFKGGSMPPEFYTQCDLGWDGYHECMAYGEEVGIPVFFSVFGPKYRDLAYRIPGRPYKISGSQFETMTRDELQIWNTQKAQPVIISVPKTLDSVIEEKRDVVTNMNLMYVTPYLPATVDFEFLEYYVDVFERPVGYSDHTRGILYCRIAIEQYGCRLVEKHFNLWGRQSFAGKVYRDSLHAADASQLARLAKALI